MKLADWINRTLYVSVPAVFGDDEARRCVLVDMEPAGLWLQSEALRGRFKLLNEAAPELPAPVTAFIPYAQILYVLDVSQLSVLVRGEAAGADSRLTAPQPAAASHDEPQHGAPHREGRAKEKHPKRGGR